MVISTVVAEPVETRFLEGSHFVKGRFWEFGARLEKPLTTMVAFIAILLHEGHVKSVWWSHS